jgi:hypothetical protein
MDKQIRYTITIDFPGNTFKNREELKSSLIKSIERMVGTHGYLVDNEDKVIPTSEFDIKQYIK